MASCGSSTARPGKFLDYKETVYQNVFDSIDKKTGEVHYRNDIVEQSPDNGCRRVLPPKAGTTGRP